MSIVTAESSSDTLLSAITRSRRKMQAHQARQRGLRPEFVLLTAQITQELLGYARHFERIEAVIASESPGLKEALTRRVRDLEGPAFLKAFDSGIQRLSECVKNYTEEEHKRHAFFFRNQTWPLSIQVPVMQRCLTQPRGYPGDSGIMQMMYDVQYAGASILAQLMHWHAIHAPAADAVRNRRKLIADHLAQIADRLIGAETRVLSVACGPAAELHEILAAVGPRSRFQLVLMDQDPLALEEAQQSLISAQAQTGVQVQAQCAQLSALDVVEGRHGNQLESKFDFIYSMGLFDYLPTDFARQLACKLFSFLKPNGELLLGNYHVSNPHQVYMRYWSDWTLIYRTEEEMVDLFRDVAPASIDVGFEPSKTQMFVRVQARSEGP